MKYAIAIEYADTKQVFIKDFEDEFFPSEEGRRYMGDEEFDALIHANIVDDFYSHFSLEVKKVGA